MDEYVKLKPEEQLLRLKAIIKKIDLDSDGFLTEGKGREPEQLAQRSLRKERAARPFIRRWQQLGGPTV